MKRMLFVIVIAMFSSVAMAQVNDTKINLKDGNVLKCSSITIDSISQTLEYVIEKTGTRGKVQISNVGSYSINGVLNPYIPGAYEKQLKAIEENKGMVSLAMKEDDKNEAVGYQMIKFSNTAQTGLALMLVGSGISTIPWILNYDANDNLEKFQNKQKAIAGVGLGVTAIGLIVFIASFDNTRKAGKIMQVNDKLSLKLSDNGIGMAFKINNN